MRSSADMAPPRRPRRPNRIRVIIIVAAVVLFLLVASLRSIANVYTDYLWYDSLGRTDIWWGVLRAQAALVGIFTGVFFVLLLVNLIIADRLSPGLGVIGPDEELLRRYREVVDRRAGLVRVLIAGAIAITVGLGMGAQWQQWLLFVNGSPTGVNDPQFEADLGFYLFELPFLVTAVDWLFAALFVVLIVTVIAHYLNGGIRLQSPVERVTPQVKAHVSVLLGALAIVKAVDYYLERFELVYSTRGAVQGATYTDVNAQLPALNLLIIIALLSAVLFLVNIRRRGWVLPVLAVGLWLFVFIVAGAAYPAIIQRFQVLPAQSSKEAPYIERNIEFTRMGLNMSKESEQGEEQRPMIGSPTVETQPFSYTSDLELATEAVAQNPATIRNVRLLDPGIVQAAYQRLQADRGFYSFRDLDIDRYPITTPEGTVEDTQVVIATRELESAGIPDPTWENERLAYTHGYGLALSAANATTDTGLPDFLVGDIPVRVEDERIDTSVEVPQLYIGEDLDGYAIVGTTRDEVDYPEGGATVPFRYTGDAGVPMDGFLTQAAFASRFADWNPLISNFVTDESRVIFHRDVQERVEMVAPFLSLDGDPYPAVIDGRVVYIVDGYTTSDAFPYSETVSTEGLAADSGLNQEFNYIRNSVKGVVDAYDGTVELYVIDDQDPLIAAWWSAFPDLFRDSSEMDEDLRAHLRYPEDMFRVQTTMWGRYHIDDPRGFLEQTNSWDVAQNPGSTVAGGSSSANGAAAQAGAAGSLSAPEQRIDPYYQILRLPGDQRESFVLTRPFVPRSNDQSKKLTAFMAAKSDATGELGADYGKLVVYELPSDLPVNGPSLVAASIQSNEEVSSRVTLLSQQGSSVEFGNTLLLPMAQDPNDPNSDATILYARPLYVRASGDTQVPELKNVILVFGERVVMAPTLRQALAEMFPGVEVTTFEGDIEGDVVGDTETDGSGDEGGEGGDGTTPPTTQPPTQGEPSDDVTTELERIAGLFDEADAALRAGDAVLYAQKVEQAEAALRALQGRVSSSTTTTTTAPPGSA